jgi:Domain of unknown function (DUF3471)/Beta-lactamase
MRRCIFCVLLLAAGTTWARASQPPPILEDEAIRKTLSTRVDLQKQATGIVVGIIDSKESHVVSYGTMGLGNERPVNGDTLFDIGSITKVFTAVGGYRSFIGFDPKARAGVVALANAQTAVGADDIGLHLLDEHIHVDLHVPKPHHEILVRPEILDRYTGCYQFSPTDILTVTREGNRLFGQEREEKFEMFAEGEHDLFLKILDAQVTFEPSGQGPAKVSVWHQGGQDQRGGAHRVIFPRCRVVGCIPETSESTRWNPDRARITVRLPFPSTST